MDPDLEPPNYGLMFLLASAGMPGLSLLTAILVLLFLLFASAMISGSEIAFFSLSPEQISKLKNQNDSTASTILKLRSNPAKLLATILISNNFVNIAIVLISDFILKHTLGNSLLKEWAAALHNHGLFTFVETSTLANIINFLIAVVGVTFILVLFGEVMPKIYANINNMKLARAMAKPLNMLTVIFNPISNIMVKWTDTVQKRLEKNKKHQLSSDKENIENALDITLESEDPELDILKSILKFNDVSVKQIMTPRIDVVSIDIDDDYESVLKTVRQSGFSRIPVHKEDFDNIVGILYAKDLISHLDESPGYKWQNLIRKNILYVPESKKINDLLKEFQKKKLHIAIVVDEYGGSAGIITMEDIMEEILGEIIDEFDEENEDEYVQLDEHTFIFEGKTLLLDFVKVFNKDIDIFDDIKGEAGSLAGLILETIGYLPEKGHIIKMKDFTFEILEVSERRIKKVKVIYKKQEQNDTD